ncbi:MAG: diacylglycerol kinase family lipid kinase [Phycisphaerae bacterium]
MAAGLVRVIVNPISGHGQDPHFIRDLVRHVSLRGFPVDVHRTRGRGHAARMARSVPDDARCIVSIGGDGTHSEVLSGLAGRPVPVAIVPSGTENVLAKTFGLSGTLRETVRLVQQGRAVALDLALAGDCPFVMFSGVGFDAEVTRDVHRKRSGPILRAAYYGPTVRRWWKYGFPPITVQVDGHTLCDDAGMVFVCNTPLYADGLRLGTLAVGDDGLLDVVCFRTRSRWHMLRHYVRARLGRHLDHPLVAYGQGRRIEVACEERPLPVQADGDIITDTPLAYTVRRRAVRLMVRPEATEAGPRA